jgi:hypothetical protein
MMDGEQPVIIDFDSTRPIGEKLDDKGGTSGSLKAQSYPPQKTICMGWTGSVK